MKKTDQKSAKKHPLVGVIMGSDSDLAVMQGAIDCLKDFSISYEVQIVSAHRTPQAMIDYGSGAHARGLQTIIAGAGGAAHLPGMVAAVALIPVIGVPVHITKLDGLDALLSVVQMPKGVPVATVAIDNSFNAGLLAIRILALQDSRLMDQLAKFRQAQMKKVSKANQKMKRAQKS